LDAPPGHTSIRIEEGGTWKREPSTHGGKNKNRKSSPLVNKVQSGGENAETVWDVRRKKKNLS